MVHIPDKAALFREVLRVLRPDGVFAASDWLGGEITDTSPEWARFRELGHLSFAMATAAESEALMRAAGFTNISTHDRNEWYAPVCSEEVEQLEGPLREKSLQVVDEAVYRHWLNVRRALAESVAAGALRPTHLRGYKALVSSQPS
jgi:phosphoethanolamine N-methyltransferase